MHHSDDSIAAIATAPGAAGLAVVRVSGRDAIAIADSVFAGASRLADAASHTLHHGWAVRPANGLPAQRLDEIVAAVFRAPRSYTREDVVELSCHGGAIPAERVLAALLAAGARLATPGEFTLRAFLSGRIDLAQAEAVADVIHAETGRAHDLAVSQLAGELSRRLAGIEERVTDALAEIEARVDFAEDVGGIEVPAHVVDALRAVEANLGAMLAGSAYARAVREGVRVPLVGRPNVGKSSLFNALLGEERAIVTPVPGTTRDRVSEAIEIAGVRVTLSDTAGLRETDDAVEAIGVERTHAALDGAALVLWVVDGSRPLEAEDRALAQRLDPARTIVVLNKSDLAPRVSAADVAAPFTSTEVRVVAASAARGDGLDAVRGALSEKLGGDSGEHAASAGAGDAIGNRRHVEALDRGRAALARALAAAADQAPGEIVALELRDTLAAIGEVTGREVAEDVLDRIFGRFCIGK